MEFKDTGQGHGHSALDEGRSKKESFLQSLYFHSFAGSSYNLGNYSVVAGYLRNALLLIWKCLSSFHIPKGLREDLRVGRA